METSSIDQLPVSSAPSSSVDTGAADTPEVTEVQAAQDRLRNIFAESRNTVFVEGGAELPWYPDE